MLPGPSGHASRGGDRCPDPTAWGLAQNRGSGIAGRERDQKKSQREFLRSLFLSLTMSSLILLGADLRFLKGEGLERKGFGNMEEYIEIERSQDFFIVKKSADVD